MPEIRKTGTQSEASPTEFVLSTDTPDRYGDIVRQDWDLRAFRKNPIALFQHRSSQPIGTWRKVRVEDGKLMGILDLAREGTSELIDTLRSLLDQRILRAVSVGFSAEKATPLDPDNPWDGYELAGNELHEVSLVSVPANAEALAVKSLDASARELVAPQKEVIRSAYDVMKAQHKAQAQARARRNQITRLRTL